MQRIINILIIFLVFAGQTLFAEEIDPGTYLKQNVVQKKVGNGINVIMLNRGYTPTLALLISFKVGSVDESYKSMGMSHMLEHMLFKGTEEIGTSDYKAEKVILDKIESVAEELDNLRLNKPEDKRIEVLEKEMSDLQIEARKYTSSSPYSLLYAKNGGVGFNASTSRDSTVYVIELPSSKLELWAELESKRIKNPVLREFYIERDTIFEERLMRYESSGPGMLFEKFIAASFEAHPYRHPIIGWESNIKYFSINDAREFYKTHYTPERMTITVVGKQNVDDTYKLIEKYFGSMEKSKTASDVVIKEPDQKGEKRIELNFESSPYVMIGWHKPAFPAKEDYVFDIIASILAEGRSSRLYKSLVVEKKIASSVEAWNGYPGARYDNLFIIAASPESNAQIAENAVYDEIERLKKDVTEDEIQKAKNKMETSFVFEIDSNMGVARLVSYYQTMFGNWQYITDYLNVLKTITVKDVKEASNKYITKENRTVGVLNDNRKK